MRPRGDSFSFPVSRYVGQAPRQRPQCTHASDLGSSRKWGTVSVPGLILNIPGKCLSSHKFASLCASVRAEVYSLVRVERRCSKLCHFQLWPNTRKVLFVPGNLLSEQAE